MLTEIKFIPTPTEGRCVAEGHIIIDARFKVAGIRVIRGSRGPFVSWPSFQEPGAPPATRSPIFEVIPERERWCCEVEILAAVVPNLPVEVLRA